MLVQAGPSDGVRWLEDGSPTAARSLEPDRGERVGSVIKKRRKKMRKHKQRKLLKRQRHKK
jgi:hypothetical protein